MSTSLLNTQIENCRKKMRDLNNKLQREVDRESKAREDASRAKKSFQRTKSQSTMKTKQRSIDRNESKANDALKEQSKLRDRLNAEEKKLDHYEARLTKAQQKEARRLSDSIKTRTSQGQLDTLQKELDDLRIQAEQSLEIDHKNEKIVYDVFISHSSKDKDEFVSELSESLTDAGLKVFEDTRVMKLGDSITDKINEGIKYSKVGIVVLSENFFKSNWSDYEQKGFLHREMQEGRTVILPIWHNVTYEQIQEYNPVFVDKFALSTNKQDIQEMVDMIVDVVPS